MQATMRFDGATYDHTRDQARLANQYENIFALMRDGQWRTYREIADVLGYPEGSIGAQLRHMRKARFGAHTVERRSRTGGLHEYRLIVNQDAALPLGRNA